MEKQKFQLRFLLFLILFLSSTGNLFTQYYIQFQSVNHGGKSLSSSNYTLHSSVGQTFQGERSNADLYLKEGYIYSYSSGEELVTIVDSVDVQSSSSAAFHGTVLDTGSSAVTERGFYWKVYDGTPPTSNDNILSETGTFGIASYNLTENTLQPETQYSISAFADNSSETTASTKLDFWTFSLVPDAHSNLFQLDSVIDGTSMIFEVQLASQISNAEGYLILAKENATPDLFVMPGNEYNIGDRKGDSKVVGKTTNPNDQYITASSLSPDKNYHFVLIPLNWNGSNSETFNYLKTGTIPGLQQATPIPTLSEWAMIFLLTLTPVIGLYFIRKS